MFICRRLFNIVFLAVLILCTINILGASFASGQPQKASSAFLEETIYRNNEKRWNGKISYRVVGLKKKDRILFIRELSTFGRINGVTFDFAGESIGESNIIFIFEYSNVNKYISTVNKLFSSEYEQDIVNRLPTDDKKWIIINKKYTNQKENYALASVCFLNNQGLTRTIAQHVWFNVFISPMNKSDVVVPSFCNTNGNDIKSISEFDLKLIQCFYKAIDVGHVIEKELINPICICISNCQVGCFNE